MDVKSHMANNTTEESQTPKVVSAYSKRKQSHVTLHRHCVYTNGCEKSYGEQHDRGVVDSEGGVRIIYMKREQLRITADISEAVLADTRKMH